MQMEMEDCLAAMTAIIYYQPVTVLIESLFFGCLPGSKNKMAQQFAVFGLHVLNSGQVFFWYNQEMNRGLRMDVMENHQLIVFMNDPGWTFPGNNSTKNTIHHSIIFQIKLSVFP